MAGPSPVVSVILPAYNAEAYIERAIRSALDQTLAEVEVVVFDDGSVDRTGEIAARLAGSDDRVRILTGDRNRGVGHARNRAIREATGEWIALLDADDTYDEDRLQRLLEANDDRFDLIADNFRMWRNGRWKLLFQETGDRSMNVVELLSASLDMRRSGNFGMLQPIVRRTFLERHAIEYREHLRCYDDFVFLMECLSATPSLFRVSQPGYNCTVRSGSLSRGSNRGADVRALEREIDRLIGLYPGEANTAVRELLARKKVNLHHYAEYRDLIDALHAERWSDAAKKAVAYPRAVAWAAQRGLRLLTGRY